MGGNKRFIAFTGKLAIALQFRGRHQHLRQLLIADEEPRIPSIQSEQALDNQAFQNALAHLGAVQLRLLDSTALGSTDLVLLRHQGLLEFLRSNLLAADGRHIVPTTRVLDIGLDPPQGKRQGDQYQKELNETAVVANDIKHKLKLAISEKGEPRGSPFDLAEWTENRGKK